MSLAIWILAVALASTSVSARRHFASIPVLRDLVNESTLFVGTASNYYHIQEDKEYATLLQQQFSITTPENSCKWGALRPSPDQFNFKACDFIVQTAETNKQLVRGHNLCWGQWNPSWLNHLAGNADKLKDALSKHISTVAGRYAGRLYAWDVVNEAVSDNPKPGDVLKKNIWYPTVPDYIDEAFKYAYAADKHAKLFYNDYNAEAINPKSDAIYSMVKEMQSKGIPIHGVGLQAHFALNINNEENSNQSHTRRIFRSVKEKHHTLYSPVPSDWDTVGDNIKRFIDLGLEVHITEMDVKVTGSGSESKKLSAEADAYRGMLHQCLKYAPKCRSFEVWGFVDKYSWISSQELPDLFDSNFKPKPCFYSVASELNSTTRFV